jgi:transposase
LPNTPSGASGTAGRHIGEAHPGTEPGFAGLKQFRAIATRYRKIAGSLLVALQLAAAIIRLN